MLTIKLVTHPAPELATLPRFDKFSTKKLPLEVGEVRGPYWTRTSDPIDVNDVLYQLSQRTILVTNPTNFYIRGQIFGCVRWNVRSTD